MAEPLDELADVVLGTRYVTFDRTVKRRRDGVVHKLSNFDERLAGIEERMDNGGIQMQQTRTEKIRAWATVVAAFVGMVGAVVAAVILAAGIPVAVP